MISLRPKLLLVISCALFAFLLFTIVPLLNSAQESKPGDRRPAVVINVKDMEVVSTNIKNAEGAGGVAIIQIRNNSDKPIIALTLESGNAQDTSGITINGFDEERLTPKIILEAHKVITVNFPLSDVRPGFPIRVRGVMYADGTEDGDAATLATMRRQKEPYKYKEPKTQ